MIPTLLIVLAAGAAQPVIQPAAVPVLDKDPTSMSQSEIRAFNAGRTRTDPDFIRCIRTEETGSLVRKTFSCHTNAQWELDWRNGNQTARDAIEKMTQHGINNSQ